ncbi:MAG: orotidine-5'-phosphate decarboxylase [Veillonellaceae bacterium]|nr:orotidine-5'-phosphate decarboxylase [Veillonellaceae bacterium]
MADNRLIIALDYSEISQVKKLIVQLDDSISYYKVGMELFYSTGGQIISFLRERNKNVFLDLKLYDIPNTVAKSAAALTRLGVSMLNVHASGGAIMMKVAAEAVGEEAYKRGLARPKLIAVTVLTSFSEQEWASLNSKFSIDDQVIYLAKIAKQSGIDGVVASPREAAAISAGLGKEFLIVTPGIRPEGSSVNDQNRISTPKQALMSGATHLVVGRPVTASEDPRAAVESILTEMRAIS